MAHWTPFVCSFLVPLGRKFGRSFYLNRLCRIHTTRVVPEATSSWRMEHNSEPGWDETTTIHEGPFTVCPKCHGDGHIVHQASKKQKLRHKRARTNGDYTDTPAPQRLETCRECDSSGLVQSDTDPPVDTTLPEIAVVGGGLAGLALAAACRHRGMKYTVYERDLDFHQRSQGYGLTMQQATKALKGLGIHDSLDSDGIMSTKHVVHEPDGAIVGEWGLRKWGRSERAKKPKRQNIHIARQSLRWQLYKAAGGRTANIAWNHRLLQYKQRVDAPGWELKFQVDDQIVAHKADLIVGADGLRSQVRRSLIGEDRTPLRFLDCIVILGICPIAGISLEGQQSDLLDGETVFQTADGVTRIYIMPFTTTAYMWQLSFPMAEEQALSLSSKGPSALKKEAIRRCQSWHTPVPDILYSTPIELVSGYPVYDRALLTPELLQETASVTLVGDACHPMSPFKGQGANQALLDALALVRSIYKHCKTAGSYDSNSLERAVKEFEVEMLVRSAVKVEASAEAARFLHTEIAIQKGNVTRGAASRSILIKSNEEDTATTE